MLIKFKKFQIHELFKQFEFFTTFAKKSLNLHCKKKLQLNLVLLTSHDK